MITLSGFGSRVLGDGTETLGSRGVDSQVREESLGAGSLGLGFLDRFGLSEAQDGLVLQDSASPGLLYALLACTVSWHIKASALEGFPRINKSRDNVVVSIGRVAHWLSWQCLKAWINVFMECLDLPSDMYTGRRVCVRERRVADPYKHVVPLKL